ncbi:MAG TPA: SGNH/GDSL hydrolase family protein [Solirubrobacteraceae bacterium]
MGPKTLGALAAALLAGLLAAPAAGATGRPPVVPGSRYLALGDSVTFGYQEPFVVPSPKYTDPGSFLAYPEQLGAELHLIVANPACPGETSASLIDARAESNGCENTLGAPTGYRRLWPLHVRYKGSQLAYAVRYLRAHRDVALVSLMIGANDLFICQETTHDGCGSAPEQAAAFAKIRRNVGKILSAIRNQAHYRGQLAIVNYYSLDYTFAFITGAVRALNKAQDSAARPFHVEIGNGFREFEAASLHFGGKPCQAGLLTLHMIGPPPTCGVHPSYAGQALLAQALEKAIAL